MKIFIYITRKERWKCGVREPPWFFYPRICPIIFFSFFSSQAPKLAISIKKKLGTLVPFPNQTPLPLALIYWLYNVCFMDPLLTLRFVLSSVLPGSVTAGITKKPHISSNMHGFLVIPALTDPESAGLSSELSESITREWHWSERITMLQPYLESQWASPTRFSFLRPPPNLCVGLSQTCNNFEWSHLLYNILQPIPNWTLPKYISNEPVISFPKEF